MHSATRPGGQPASRSTPLRSRSEASHDSIRSDSSLRRGAGSSSSRSANDRTDATEPPLGTKSWAGSRRIRRRRPRRSVLVVREPGDPRQLRAADADPRWTRPDRLAGRVHFRPAGCAISTRPLRPQRTHRASAGPWPNPDLDRAPRVPLDAATRMQRRSSSHRRTTFGSGWASRRTAMRRSSRITSPRTVGTSSPRQCPMSRPTSSSTSLPSPIRRTPAGSTHSASVSEEAASSAALGKALPNGQRHGPTWPGRTPRHFLSERAPLRRTSPRSLAPDRSPRLPSAAAAAPLRRPQSPRPGPDRSVPSSPLWSAGRAELARHNPCRPRACRWPGRADEASRPIDTPIPPGLFPRRGH